MKTSKIITLCTSLFTVAAFGCVAPDEAVEGLEQAVVPANDGYSYDSGTSRFTAVRNGITGSAEPKHYVFRVEPSTSVNGEITWEQYGNARLDVSFSNTDGITWTPSGSTCNVTATSTATNKNCNVTGPADARLVRVTVSAATGTRTHFRFALRFSGPTHPGEAHLPTSTTTIGSETEDGTLVHKAYVAGSVLPSVFRGQDVTVTINRGTNAGLALENGIKLKALDDNRTEYNRLTCGAWVSGVLTCGGRVEHDSIIHIPILQSTVSNLGSISVTITREGPEAPQPTYLR